MLESRFVDRYSISLAHAVPPNIFGEVMISTDGTSDVLFQPIALHKLSINVRVQSNELSVHAPWTRMVTYRGRIRKKHECMLAGGCIVS